MAATLGVEGGNNTHYIGPLLSLQQRRVHQLYWVERLPQTAVAQELRISQPTVWGHIVAVRRAYAKIGVQLPKPVRTGNGRPKLRAGRKYTPHGVVEIDVARLVNQLRELRRLTRSGAVGDAQILGTVLLAIENDRVQEEIARLVRPAAGGGRCPR